ncbi:hypothetical protein C453_07198 [Haloferax elongans ATCC BAA-1513]|uniref:Small CPxCG-related zinc finger protein n=1 Tax=Haloferax elongans ATCC BAA-1513 TaxID=1230453 RepID=M0HPB3_HALEO|nr:hypothetical protein [Haloferax elongans]ELZ85583.1 hypothetical protein C453_07198 [Haloferax elongans ATCC BAA-1513]
MSFEWVSYFTCHDCGLQKPSPEVPYDHLGYAICPACGAETRPTTAAATTPSTMVDG